MAIWKRLRFGLLILAGLLLLFVVARFRSDPDDPTYDFSQKQLPGVQQVVVVEGSNEGGNRATVSMFELDGDGTWGRVRGPYNAFIGRNGFRDIDRRTEGDGTTPIGVFWIPSAFGGAPAPGGTRLPYEQITTAGQCWISDPNDPAYNRWVLRSPCDPPNVDLFVKSQPDAIFRSAIVIGFNFEFRRAGSGSALFLHNPDRDANGNAQPTAGGIAISDEQVRSLIGALDLAKNPVVVMGPTTFVNSPSSR